MNENDKKEDLEKENKQKRKYVKPTIESEDLMAFGAVCNGTMKGGRKAAVGAPSFCNANKLNS